MGRRGRQRTWRHATIFGRAGRGPAGMRGCVSKKSRKQTKEAAKKADAAAELPPLEPPAPVENQPWNLKWLGMGAALMVLAFGLVAAIARYAPLAPWIVGVIGLLTYVGVGVLLGQFGEGKRVLQPGVSAAVVFIVAASIVQVAPNLEAVKVE